MKTRTQAAALKRTDVMARDWRLGGWFAAAMGGALAALAGCTPAAAPGASHAGDGAQPSDPVEARGKNAAPAARAPDFELESLAGTSLRLSRDQQGKVLVLDFWATYCEPCIAAMPHLQALQERHGARGFAVWGISIDGPESVAAVRSLVARLGVSFPILLDEESRVVALYNPRTTAPFTVLVGRGGQVLNFYEGYSQATEQALDADLERALQ